MATWLMNYTVEEVVRKMDKVKTTATELLRDFGPFMPIAWVLTCYELGCSWILERRLEGVLTFFASLIIISVLYGIGLLVLAGEHANKSGPDGDPNWTLSQRLVRLLVLIIIMILITVKIANSGPPSDVI